MTAPSFTYSGNVFTGAAAGTVDFALTSTTGNPIAYLEPSHIHVYKSSDQGSTWTELTRPAQWDFVTSGTVARLATGISLGDWVKVQRITPSSPAYVTFQSSSLLTAEQLNDDTLFNTYLNQERSDQGDQSTLTANNASTAAASATTTANAATTTANTALSTANTALSTANTASSNASAAVTTANTASTNASAAVATANTASTNASAAVATANTASTSASSAVTTANSAVTTANSAVTTANNANTTAQAANTTATNAESIANSALSIVAGTVQFVPVADVAAIPASPSNDDAIQVQDSTGIQSFTPLTGLPAGFLGTPQLFVRLQYDTPGSTWQYVGYGANDPDNRYVVQGITGTANNPSFYFDPDTGIYSPGSNELGLSTGGAARLTIDSAGNVAIPGTLGVTGAITGSLTGTASLNVLKAGDTMTGNLTAPAFIPNGSTAPTNGLYLPAANSVALSTNSSERIRIGANGEIGLGGANYGTSGQVLTSAGSGAAPTWQTPAAVAVDKIEEGNTSAEVIDTGSDGRFVVTTEGTERLRVTDTGLVGIGASSPSSRLHVSGSEGTLVNIQGTSASAYLLLGNSNNNLGYIGYEGTKFNFYPNNTANALVVTPTGVGIGTSSPGTLLHIASSSVDPEIRLVRNPGAGNINSVKSDLYDLTFTSGRHLLFNAAGAERMRIDSAGDIGMSSGLTLGNINPSLAGFYSTTAILGTGAGTNAVKFNTSSGKFTYDTSSRLNKDQIEDCPYGIAEIKLLQPRRYYRIDDQRLEVGFVADEVFDVLPEFVPFGPKSAITGNENDTESIPLGVNYEKLTAVLTAALQEAIGEIELLKARLTAAGI